VSDFDENKIRRLDGSLLLVFRELLRRRRATEVAKRLGLSSSAVSHALARLRDLFDDPLFVRRPHGLEPTRRALELSPRIERLIELAAGAMGSDGGFDPATTERRFVVGAPEFVAVLIGAPLVEAMSSQAPKASVTIVSLGQDAALDALRRGELDLAVGRFGHLRPGLASEVLFEDEYCVVARRGHPTIAGRVNLKAYGRAGLVLATAPAEVASDEVLPGAHLVDVRAYVPRWLMALSMVSTSDAIACCPRRLAERLAVTLNLQVMATPYASSTIKVLAVRRVDSSSSPVDWLVDQVRQAVGRNLRRRPGGASPARLHRTRRSRTDTASGTRRLRG
jgi:DNA-binding transcriptional LysR family regulator